MSVGADIHADGNHAIQLAIESDQLEIVKYLVSIGADIRAISDYTIQLLNRRKLRRMIKYLVSVAKNH